MKPIERYQCEICKQDYSTPDYAERCEKRHLSPIKIERYIYDTLERYPKWVVVRFSDGRIIKYERTY